MASITFLARLTYVHDDDVTHQHRISPVLLVGTLDFGF
jgi:hypothetical protein